MLKQLPPDDYVLPEAVYPLETARRILGVSRTTMHRIENVQGIRLPRIRLGQKPFVRGTDLVAWIEEVDRRQAAAAIELEGGER